MYLKIKKYVVQNGVKVSPYKLVYIMITFVHYEITDWPIIAVDPFLHLMTNVCLYFSLYFILFK